MLDRLKLSLLAAALVGATVAYRLILDPNPPGADGVRDMILWGLFAVLVPWFFPAARCLTPRGGRP
jgi:hypothetical protein